MATADAEQSSPLLFSFSTYFACSTTTTTSSLLRPWRLRSFFSSLLLLSLLFLSFPRMASNACKKPLLPSSPPVSNLTAFLQQVQEAALSTLGSNSSSFDPKTYVDLPLRFPLDATYAAFNSLPRNADGNLSKETFNQYIEAYFLDAGSDLVEYTPVDYVPEPPGFLPHVRHQALRSWALEVHAIWLELAREVAHNVMDEPDQHTLLALPKPVIVPGSRFREVYYWDSYWIIRGLIVSKMFHTAKDMVQNLLYLVRVYGFVLNGARIYYENRSQPPLLSAMVREVFVATNDMELLQEALPLLIEEHKYWTSGPKQVTLLDRKDRKHSLSRYYANWKAPRPESSTIDMQVAEGVVKSKQELLYLDIASAAESGWDFGSRWLRDGENLSTLFTTSILPADLNAYIFQMEKNIAYFAEMLGNQSVSGNFSRAARARRLAMNSIMWNDKMGQWFDYQLDFSNCKVHQNKSIYLWNEDNQRKISSISNFLPIWCGILKSGDSRVVKLVNALNLSGLLFPAGLATSLKKTGQQWDFPNAWPPLQHMIIEGLFFSGSEEGRYLARMVAQRWIQTNYAVFKKTGLMLEKYDATVCGGIGGGGEYVLQTGFGWSNGVVLALLSNADLLIDSIKCPDGKLRQ